MDAAVPSTPHTPQQEPLPADNPSQIRGDYVAGSKVITQTAGGDIVGRDKITTIYSEEKTYDVSGLPNPYLGLRSFTYAERARYAGRRLSVEEGLAKLTTPGEQRTLLFVTGASGCGKSSFAQAGLLPALEEHYQQRGQDLRHAVIRPGSHPMAALDDALNQLRTGAESSGGQSIRVLIIDQFEELFTQSVPEERNRLFHWLTDQPEFRADHQHIITTLRSDYLNELFEVKLVWEAAKQGIELRAMRGEELKDAIQRPLWSAVPNGEKRMEPELVERLAEDAASDATYLPLLQVTLEELWKMGRLVLSNYGTLTDAIKQRANQVFEFADYDSANPGQKRTTAEQEAILDLFLSLVNVSPDDDPRRDVRISRATTELTREQHRLTLDLSRARLLSVEEEANVETVNIIHETLINNWDLLREGVKARRQKLRQRARFEQLLQQWLANNKSDDYLLLTSVQLAEARELDQAGDVALRGPNAQELLRRSAEHEEAERQRELQQARALADEQRRRAESERQGAARLRRRAIYLGGALAFAVLALVFAVFFSLVAVFFWGQSSQNSSKAQAASTLAVGETTRSAIAAATAVAAEADAQRQAKISLSRQLAAQSTSYLDNGLDLSLLLSQEGYRVEKTFESLSSLLAALEHSPRLTTFLRGHADSVWSVAFSPDGKMLASGSGDKIIILWDVSNPKAPIQLGAPLTGHTASVNSMAFSPDGKTLASGSDDQTIILWDVSNPRAPVQLGAPLTGHTASVNRVAFSPDGKTLASGSDDQTIILWDVSNPKAPLQLGAPLTGHTNVVFSVAFSPDGRTLASGSTDKTIILWDVSNPKASVQLGAPLTGHTASVSSVAFSPDGKTLASGSATIILWDVSNPKAPLQLGAPLTGHAPYGVYSVAFSPDGKVLASGSLDKTIILWDVSNPKAPLQLGAPLTGHTNVVESVAFSLDGRTLASGSSDNTIILWDVSPELWKAHACRIANRNLTQVEWARYLGDAPYQKTCPDLAAGN